MALGLDELQEYVGDWHRHWFPDVSPTRVVLKLVEEAGELAAAHNKHLAYAAPTWEQSLTESELDAIGDIAIVLLALCDRFGYSLTDRAEITWSKVAIRDAERIGK